MKRYLHDRLFGHHWRMTGEHYNRKPVFDCGCGAFLVLAKKKDRPPISLTPNRRDTWERM